MKECETLQQCRTEPQHQRKTINELLEGTKKIRLKTAAATNVLVMRISGDRKLLENSCPAGRKKKSIKNPGIIYLLSIYRLICLL
jgi:hypothetical protein